MTIRDLTPKQIYNLKRRCEKERKQWGKRNACLKAMSFEAWKAAYSAGLKAGMELLNKPQ